MVKNFLMRYFDQYTIKFKKDIKKSEYNNIISNGIKLYIIERAIRELSYELDHRPKNAFIPLLTIWENLNRDIINYSPI
jgi:predicted trehalose synthase